TIRCALPAGHWPAGALFPARASAPGAVSARRVLGAAHREKADLCSRAELSTRRVVLFSGGLCFQIAAGVLTLASPIPADCASPAIAQCQQRFCDSLTICGNAAGTARLPAKRNQQG